MPAGPEALTAREKETLRLLSSGHDAKSIARRLNLSVHTINERLRDARAKLGVSSSREAARLLAEAERNGPDSVGDKDLGVSPDAAGVPGMRRPDPPGRPHGAAHRFAWFGGGMLAMSLVITAAVLSFMLNGGGPAAVRGTPATAASEPSVRPDPAASAAARGWLALLDRGRWEESWRMAGSSFTAQITAAQWAATARSVREPLGPVSARAVRTAVRAGSLPGLPPGDYQVVEFATGFARRTDAVERVVLAREGGRWRVIGYFIR